MLQKYRALFGLVVFTLILVSTPVLAQNGPIQLALVTPIQIVPEDNSISGVRLNLIYGRNVFVRGLDLGLANHTTANLSKGVQLGAVNLVDSDFVGWQDASVNVTKGNFKGFQWGIVNYAGSANGFQLGIINYAANMRGLQIGVVNIIKQGGTFPVFPIVNWSF